MAPLRSTDESNLLTSSLIVALTEPEPTADSKGLKSATFISAVETSTATPS